MSRDEPLPSVGIVSLGCAKNLVDSESLLGRLGAAGFPVALSAEVARVLVVNTCAFIAPAVEESEDYLARCLDERDQGRVEKVVVMGCLPLRDIPSPLLGRADAVFGVGEHDALVRYLQGGSPAPEEPGLHPPQRESGRFLLTPGHMAYLRVSEGCDNRCAYCTIPGIRGPLRSKPLEALRDEAEELVRSGVRELELVAQDTAAWGRDLAGDTDLADLLEALAALPGLRWIRALYLHPGSISRRVVEVAARGGPVLPYFDVPIQHGDDRVLEAMNRRVTGDHIRRLLGRIREGAPDAVLRTTVMVGFPGETDGAFQNLLDLLVEAKFDRVGAFLYSREVGTAAHAMEGQVPEDVKEERLAALLDAVEAVAAGRNRALLGQDLEAVVDEPAGRGLWRVRTWREAYDIDPPVIVAKRKLATGRRGTVRLASLDGAGFRAQWMRALRP